MAETSLAGQTVIETQADGTTVIRRHVREWQQNAPETLEQIEGTIDSWGRRVGETATPQLASELDYAEVEARVDRLTRRVKGDREQVVTETVTEWVEGPPGSGPINVEEDETQKVERPKRRFRALAFFGPRKDKPAKKAKKAAKPAKDKKGKAETPAKGKGEEGYQPQCSALTADGAQCRNSSRHGSKYCISHYGYQPPTTKGLAKRIEGDAWDPKDELTDRDSVRAKDTKPAVRKAPDTRLAARKPARKTKASKKKR